MSTPLAEARHQPGETLGHRWIWLELGLLLGLGLANALCEIALPPEAAAKVKTAVVLAGAALWSGYVLSRATRDPAVLRRWGLRLDTARRTARLVALPTVAGILAMIAFAAARGSLTTPLGFWLILLIYPLWGVAQQFLLNAILVRNLATFLPDRTVAPIAATLFSLAHAPDLPVVALTLPASLLWVWIYRRAPNLWVLGLAHGILGTTAFYLVLGRDPWAALF